MRVLCSKCHSTGYEMVKSLESSLPFILSVLFIGSIQLLAKNILAKMYRDKNVDKEILKVRSACDTCLATFAFLFVYMVFW